MKFYEVALGQVFYVSTPEHRYVRVPEMFVKDKTLINALGVNTESTFLGPAVDVFPAPYPTRIGVLKPGTWFMDGLGRLGLVLGGAEPESYLQGEHIAVFTWEDKTTGKYRADSVVLCLPTEFPYSDHLDPAWWGQYLSSPSPEGFDKNES